MLTPAGAKGAACLADVDRVVRTGAGVFVNPLVDIRFCLDLVAEDVLKFSGRFKPLFSLFLSLFH